MNQEDELPMDTDEVIELVKNIIKKATDDPDSVELAVPLEELQRMLDQALKIKHRMDLAKEREKQARKKEQAAWEEFCQQLQKSVEYGKKLGIDESRTRMLFSGKVKIANRIFSQLPDQGDTLYIQRKDKD
jgi:DNA replicative helicase MCM subunit Mcm2 (Cdc46/Mcm family)